jgi:hypothetical protein
MNNAFVELAAGFGHQLPPLQGHPFIQLRKQDTGGIGNRNDVEEADPCFVLLGERMCYPDRPVARLTQIGHTKDIFETNKAPPPSIELQAARRRCSIILPRLSTQTFMNSTPNNKDKSLPKYNTPMYPLWVPQVQTKKLVTASSGA